MWGGLFCIKTTCFSFLLCICTPWLPSWAAGLVLTTCTERMFPPPTPISFYPTPTSHCLSHHKVSTSHHFSYPSTEYKASFLLSQHKVSTSHHFSYPSTNWVQVTISFYPPPPHTHTHTHPPHCSYKFSFLSCSFFSRPLGMMSKQPPVQ